MVKIHKDNYESYIKEKEIKEKDIIDKFKVDDHIYITLRYE